MDRGLTHAASCDPLTPSERAVRMSRVRSSGNKSTEQAVAAKLIAKNISGWTSHPRALLGKPDFYFPDARLVVFVDGCFWHSCQKCARRMPRARRTFWLAKLEANRRRDNR